MYLTPPQAGLWILGEYCVSEHQIRDMVDAVLEGVGDLPIVDTEIREVDTYCTCNL